MRTPGKRICKKTQKKKTTPKRKFPAQLFRLTAGDRKKISQLAEQIRKAGNTQPIEILFVCEHGMGYSPISRNKINDLAKETKVSDIVIAHASSKHLNSINTEQLKRIGYIFSQYQDLVKHVKDCLYDRGIRHFPKFLETYGRYEECKNILIQLLEERLEQKKQPKHSKMEI